MRGAFKMKIEKDIEISSEDITKNLNHFIETDLNYEAFRELEQLCDVIKGSLEKLYTVRVKVESKEDSLAKKEIQRKLDHIFEGVEIAYNMYHEKAVARDFIPDIERKVIKDINEQMRTLGFTEKTIVERQSYLNKLSFDSLDEIRADLPFRNTVMEHNRFQG